MDNILTYIKFRSDLTFKQMPFNELDALAFTLVIGLDLTDMITGKTKLYDVMLKYKECHANDKRDERGDEKEEAFLLMAESKRYRDLFVDNYVKDINETEEKTFYAMTVYISKFEAIAVFRGTDGSLISWKENFNTLYEMPTTGQNESLKYLTALACSKRFLKISTAGHSKGGNLALYSAMCLDEKLQKKIKGIYIFDGPGFIDDITDKLGFLNIEDRIHAYVPESCVVGNLMRPTYARTVVKAEGNGVYQHDAFNWCVTPYGFDVTESTNEYSRELSEKVNNWIESIPIDERKRVVDELFGVFMKNGIMHITDLMHIDLKHLIGIIRCLTSLSSENRELLGIIIKQLRASH